MDPDARKTIIEIVFILVLVLVSALAGGFLSWYVILCCLAAACIAYLTIMCSRCQGKIKDIDKVIKEKFGQMRTLQDVLIGKPQIISLDEIINLERNVKKEIWIATYDLTYDLEFFIDTAAYNLERGITYIHYIPQDMEVSYRELVEKIKGKLRKKEAIKNKKVKFVKRELLPLNIVLYDPMSEKQGYIYVPEAEANLFLKFDAASFQQVRNYFHFLSKQ